MGVSIGDTCKIYKKCKICGETKYFKEFQPKGGKKNSQSLRKSYCRECKGRKHEKILTSESEYSYDLSQLDPSKEIILRGRAKTNIRYEKDINYEIAKQLVEEGAAGIVHSTLIHHFFNKKSFKKFVLKRDGYKCHYCGLYGNTVDHKMPKSKGGLSTPTNCVCACYKCNSKKGHMQYEKYVNQKIRQSK